MPTPAKGHRLGGSPAHQRHILSNLAAALFEHGRITTTHARARRLRPVAERLITFAKRGDLHARRQVLAVLPDKPDKTVVHKLFTEIGPGFASRQGGYTRITKIGPRKGDNAPMAVIELVRDEEPSSGRSRRRARRARPAAAPAAAAAPAEAAAHSTGTAPAADVAEDDADITGAPDAEVAEGDAEVTDEAETDAADEAHAEVSEAAEPAAEAEVASADAEQADADAEPADTADEAEAADADPQAADASAEAADAEATPADDDTGRTDAETGDTATS